MHELAKVWSASLPAIGVAVFGFAANLLITLMRTGKREMNMRHYEATLKMKSELRLQLFSMQAESVKELTTALIRTREAADDWSHVVATVGAGGPGRFRQEFVEKRDAALLAKRSFDMAGLFMPPDLHNAYMQLTTTINPLMIELAAAADRGDGPTMNARLSGIVAATLSWTSAVTRWKSEAWSDVLDTGGESNDVSSRKRSA